jgi:hypothetical protein
MNIPDAHGNRIEISRQRKNNGRELHEKQNLATKDTKNTKKYRLNYFVSLCVLCALCG